MYGGRNQNRTGLDGFAIHCITDLLSGQGCVQRGYIKKDLINRPLNMERETRFELATFTLAT